MRVAQAGPNDCWLWQGKPTSKGYGTITFNRVSYKAHRMAYHLVFGSVPNEKMVCHTCDVRLCCNPCHLYLGDAQVNAKDRQKKGRTARQLFESNGNSKLTQASVHAIRRMWHAKERYGIQTQKQLADYFGVGETSIYYILKRQRWGDLPTLSGPTS